MKNYKLKMFGYCLLLFLLSILIILLVLDLFKGESNIKSKWTELLIDISK